MLKKKKHLMFRTSVIELRDTPNICITHLALLADTWLFSFSSADAASNYPSAKPEQATVNTSV